MARALLSIGYPVPNLCRRGGSVPENQHDEEVVNIAREIKDYLEVHPNAADSLEGVVKWWLGRQRLETAASKVKKALEYLDQRGVVTKSLTVDGQTVYSMASQRSDRKT